MARYRLSNEAKKDYQRRVCGVDSIYFKINEDIIAIVGRQDLNAITLSRKQ